jgi:hypothetical protein
MQGTLNARLPSLHHSSQDSGHVVYQGATCCDLSWHWVLLSAAPARWPLDYASDAAFAGVLPCMSVPSFSQPQPYPLVLMQQATPAQGGGWMVHLFLDAAEAPAMQDAVAAQGGL